MRKSFLLFSLGIVCCIATWADTYCISVFNSTPTYAPDQTWFTYSGQNDEHILTDFVVPDKEGDKWPMYWVGCNGYSYESNLGHSNAKSANATLANVPLKAWRENTLGLAAGATGTLHIYDNSNWDNLYIEFTPAGYGLRYGVDGQPGWQDIAFHLKAGETYIWESDIVQVNWQMLHDYSCYVGLKSADSYVFSSTLSNTVLMSTILSGVRVNTLGRFRININARNDQNNWAVTWVPEAAPMTHVQGASGRALLANGMQDVHVLEQDLYVTPGDVVKLYRPDFQTFTSYTRWYDYQADARSAELNLSISPRANNLAGTFYTNITTQETATFRAPDGMTETIDIACDESAYSDGVFSRADAPEWYQVLWYISHCKENNSTKQGVEIVNTATIVSATPNIGDTYHICLTRAKKGAGNFAAYSNGTGWNGASKNWTTKDAMLTEMSTIYNAYSGYDFYLVRATDDGGYYLRNINNYYLYFNGATTTTWSQTQKTVIYLEAPATPVTDDAYLLQSADPDHIIIRSADGKYLACTATGERGWNNIRTYGCLPMDNLDDFPITEPTLSQRIIFHIHPASEIAGAVEANSMQKENETYLCWGIRKQSSGDNFPILRRAELATLADGNYLVQVVNPIPTNAYALSKDNACGYKNVPGRDWNTVEHLVNRSSWFTAGNDWIASKLTLTKTNGIFRISYNGYYLSVSETGMDWVTETSDATDFSIIDAPAGVRVGEHLALATNQNYLFYLRAKNGYCLNSGGNCSSTTASKSNYDAALSVTFLEEQTMLAPAGARNGKKIYVGPRLQWQDFHPYRMYGSATGTEIKMYYYDNSYFYNDNGTYKPCNTANGSWTWCDNGVPFTPAQVVAGQMAQLPAANAGETHIYTLQYTPTGSSKAYNICKITVDYRDIERVGPSASLGYEQVNNAYTKLLAEQNFNFDRPGVSTQKFYAGTASLLPFDQSSYGYYYPTLTPHANKAYPYWGEYGFVNYAYFCEWAGNGTPAVRMANHSDKNLTKDEAAQEGYMLYVDGSLIPGNVFMLDVAPNYCPGAKVYCSAWVGCQSGNTSSKPNLEFSVVGYYDDNEHEVAQQLTTFVTGTIETVGEWQHILFPVNIPTTQTYKRFRLKIVNKGDFSGNDFVIDDIRLYVKNPPVLPIQASSAGCIEEGRTDVVPTYLRLDYKSLVESEGELDYYYCWQDKDHVAINTTYLDYNVQNAEVTTRSGNYGHILLQNTPEDESLLYNSFRDWDNAKRDVTTTPSYGYVREAAEDGEERYFLYISQPLTVQPNHTYHAIIAGGHDELTMGNSCAMHTQLTIIGGAQILVDGGAYVDTTEICGNKHYTLDMNMIFMVRHEADGEVSYAPQAFECEADWLVGNQEFIDQCSENHLDYYAGYTFEAIDEAIREHANLGKGGSLSSLTTAQQTLITTLIEKGVLYLSQKTINVIPYMDSYGAISRMHYLAYPVHQELTSGLYTCPNPQDIFFQLPNDGQLDHIGIGQATDILPNKLAAEPRKVRILEADKNTGRITLPIFLYGNQEKTYRVETATLYRTDEEGEAAEAVRGRLSVTHDNPGEFITSETRTITLTGTAVNKLKAKQEYIFVLDLTEEENGNDCATAYTYFSIIIVPNEVHLKEDATVWNNDDAWVEGVAPLPGSNVVFPAVPIVLPEADQHYTSTGQPQQADIYYESGAQDYITYDVNYQPFSCKNIYLPVGATLYPQTMLQIGGQAYVDMPFAAGKWQLTSFPLQGVVSGDIFIPVSESREPFAIRPMTMPADRYQHPFYQNLYNASVTNATGSGSCEETVYSSTWLSAAKYDSEHTSGHTANGMAIPYGYGDGQQAALALWLDDTSNGVVRLPKAADMTYSYYDKNTNQWIGYLSDPVNRSGNAEYARPAYTEDGQRFTLRGNSPSRVFLFGNPTFAYIDMAAFMADNSEILTGAYHGYQGDNYVTSLGSVSANGKTRYYLPPYSAVLVEKTGEEATSVTVQLTDAMLTAAPSAPAAPAAQRQAAGTAVGSTITISASSGGFTTYAMAEEDMAATNLYDEQEDADVFLMAASQTPFVIYTAADHHALAINRHCSLDHLPLSLYCNDPGVASKIKTTVTFTGDNTYLGEWDLQLLGSTKSAPLTDGLRVTLSMWTDGTPTAILVHTRKRLPTTLSESAQTQVHVYSEAGRIVCLSDAPMQHIEVLSPSGQLIYSAAPQATYHEAALPAGVYIIRVDGTTTKVFND